MHQSEGTPKPTPVHTLQKSLFSLIFHFQPSFIHSCIYLCIANAQQKCSHRGSQIPKESKPSFVLSTNIYHGPTMSGGVCTETKKTVAALRNHLKGSTWRSPPPGCLPQHPGQDRGEAPPRVPWHWVLHVHDLHPLEHKAGSPCFRSSGRVLNRTHLTASLDKALQ